MIVIVGLGAIVRVYCLQPFVPVASPPKPSLSVAPSQNVYVPAVVGVPEKAPVDAFSVRPGGRVPLVLNVYGPVPPVAVMVWVA